MSKYQMAIGACGTTAKEKVNPAKEAVISKYVHKDSKFSKIK